MPTYGLTSEGYVAPTTAELLDMIRADYEAATGLEIDWEYDVFLGQITAIMATRLGELAEANQAVYDSWDVNNATGLQLGNLALIVGVTRNPATPSTATVTLGGTAGTVVTEGKVVEGGGADGKARWRLTEDVTIGGGGTVDVLVEAEEPGATLAQATEIDAIVTPVAGWASVTNAAAATPGADEETDAELRLRRQQSLQISGGRSLNAIRANVLEVDGVQAAVVIDNPDFSEQVVQGITMPPCSLAVVVHPTLTTEQEEEVARVIYDLIAAGIQTVGTDVVATVTGLDGFAKTINFDYADDLTVNVATTVVLKDGCGLSDVEDLVEEAIVAYFLTLSVGSSVRRLMIWAALAAIEGIDEVTVLLNGVDADVEPLLTEIPVLGTNAVTE